MTSSNQNKMIRSISIGASIVLGSALAFILGARVGGNLDHHTRTVTVAHTPVHAPVVQVAVK